MIFFENNEKNISKVFSFLRVQLQNKEKELLQLQRKDPSLSVPDAQQIEIVVDAIASLQLSTEDDSFVFASSVDDDDLSSSYVSACSDDFNAIKALPMNVWLAEPRAIQQAQNQRQKSIFDHLLTLPIEAYLASSWPETTNKTMSNRCLMANHLLFMSLNTFKHSATIIPTQTNKSVQSFLTEETGFAKECWLKPNMN